jgi:hypothetical protein
MRSYCKLAQRAAITVPMAKMPADGCQPGREQRVQPDEGPCVEARRVDVQETRGRSHHVVDTYMYVFATGRAALAATSADLDRLHGRPSRSTLSRSELSAGG